MNLVDKVRVLTRFARFFRQFTRQDMVAFTGLRRHAVDKIVNGLRKTGDVYVSSYAEDKAGRLTVQVFTWGRRGDAPRQPLSSAERMRLKKRRDRHAQALRQARDLAAQDAQAS